MSQNNYCNAEIGDVIKVTCKCGDVYTGRLSKLHSLEMDGEKIYHDIVLNEHPLHKGKAFGTFAIGIDDIRAFEVLVRKSEQFDYNTLPVIIKERLKEMDLSISSLAEKTAISKASLSDYLSGKTKDLGFKKVVMILNILSIDLP